MTQRELISFLSKAEKLKCVTRHSWTSDGRHESVAEHCWRLSLMAMLCADEFEGIDKEKLLKLCIIHDLGEAITGDIPAFNKTDENDVAEADAFSGLISDLPLKKRQELSELYNEISENKTEEAKIMRALDNMEAVLSHNEAPISTWIDLEYTENLRYGEENVKFSPWLTELKKRLNEDSAEKIKRETLKGTQDE